ncbi:MAG: helix-turn-helix domain-containing protein [Clostridia bacterium]|nr:helix-turn-helix domain-containing protein [Clostridia bacterium]
MLSISERTAYNLCKTTTAFKVISLGRSVRIHKQSFDEWFSQ